MIEKKNKKITVEKALAKAQILADISNNYLDIAQKEHGNFFEEKIDYTFINLKMIDDCIYWNNDTKQYEVNEIAVRNKVYQNELKEKQKDNK